MRPLGRERVSSRDVLRRTGHNAITPQLSPSTRQSCQGHGKNRPFPITPQACTKAPPSLHVQPTSVHLVHASLPGRGGGIVRPLTAIRGSDSSTYEFCNAEAPSPRSSPEGAPKGEGAAAEAASLSTGTCRATSVNGSITFEEGCRDSTLISLSTSGLDVPASVTLPLCGTMAGPHDACSSGAVAPPFPPGCLVSNCKTPSMPQVA